MGTNGDGVRDGSGLFVVQEGTIGVGDWVKEHARCPAFSTRDDVGHDLREVCVSFLVAIRTPFALTSVSPPSFPSAPTVRASPRSQSTTTTTMFGSLFGARQGRLLGPGRNPCCRCHSLGHGRWHTLIEHSDRQRSSQAASTDPRLDRPSWRGWDELRFGRGWTGDPHVDPHVLT